MVSYHGPRSRNCLRLRGTLVVLLGAALLAVLLPAPSTATIAASVTVEVLTPDPTEGDLVAIKVTVTNTGTETISDGKIEIKVYQGTLPAFPDDTKTVNIAAGASSPSTFNWVAKSEGTWTIVAFLRKSNNDLIQQSPDATVNVKKAVFQGGGGWPLGVIPGTGIPVVLVLIVVVGVVLALVAVAIKRRGPKKKVATQYDYTASTDVVGRQRYHGKMPYDFYKSRRDRFAKLKPTGMTGAGRNILGAPAPEQLGQMSTNVVDADVHMADGAGPQKKRCPTCGIEQEPTWKYCERCKAQEAIEKVEALVNTATGEHVDVQFAATLLSHSHDSLDRGAFLEASLYATNAREKIEEARKRQTRGGSGAPSDQAVVKAVLQNCSHCGMGLQPDWKQCPACKTPVTAGTAPPAGTQGPAAAPAAQKCARCGMMLVDGICLNDTSQDKIKAAEAKIAEMRATIGGRSLTGDLASAKSDAEDLLRDSKGAFEDGDLKTAIGLADESHAAAADVLTGLAAPPSATAPPSAMAAPASGTLKCAKCGMPLKASWAMCPGCETPVPKPGGAAAATAAPAAPVTCPKCRKSVKPSWAMCPFCEAPLH